MSDEPKPFKFATDADRRAWESEFMAFGQAVVDEHGKHVPLSNLQPSRRDERH